MPNILTLLYIWLSFSAVIMSGLWATVKNLGRGLQNPNLYRSVNFDL